jgi:hypothetical protein
MSTEQFVDEPYWFSKDKIGSKLSYPLKRSLLDSALHSASVYSAVYSVRYLARRHHDTVLYADFSPEWQKAHPAVPGRSSITVLAVQSEQRHAAEQLIVAEGLPILCRWLAKTQTEGNVWRGHEHMLRLEIQEGKLCHSTQ